MTSYLEEPDLFKEVLEQFGFRLAGEIANVGIVFLSVISTVTKKPFATIIEGTSSSGKSRIGETVIEQFPQFDGDFEQQGFTVVRVNSFTEPSLTRVSEINKTFFDNKFLYFGEAPDKVTDDKLAAMQCMRQLLSEGKYDKFLADTGKKHTPMWLSLRGKPNALSLKAGYMKDFQFRNRHIVINSDETQEQTEQIVDFQCQNPWEVPDEKSDFISGVVDEFLSDYKPMHVYNPYRHSIGEMFKGLYSDRIQLRRTHEDIQAVIHALASLHFKQRNLLKTPMMYEPVLEASKGDNVIALRLLKKSIELSITGTRLSYLEYYKKLLKGFSSWKEGNKEWWFTTLEAAQHLKLAPRTVNKVLNNLTIAAGLLEKKTAGRSNNWRVRPVGNKTPEYRYLASQTELEKLLKPEVIPDVWNRI